MRRTKLIFFLACVFIMFCSSICFADEEYSGDKKHQVVTPVLSRSSYTYNGEEIEVEFKNLDAQYKYIKAEGIKQTYPGEYKATLSLINPETSEWEEGGNEDKVYEWRIEKAIIRLESDIKYEYENNLIKLSLDDVIHNNIFLVDKLNDFFELSDVTEAKEIGIYNATVSIKDDQKEYLEFNNGKESVSFNWQIVRKVLSTPKLYGIQYTGEEQSVKCGSGFDAELMDLSGELTGKDAGTYTAIVSLKDKEHYVWGNNTTTDKNIEWEIPPKNIKLDTELSYNLKYNGEEQTVTGYYYFNDELMTATGVTKATEVGTYTAVFSLKDKKNYQWEFKYFKYSTDDQNFEWKIVPCSLDLDQYSNYEAEYNEEEQKVFQDYRYFDTDLINITGTTEAKEVGTYKVTISLTDKKHYQWEIRDENSKKYNYTSEDQEIEWKIVPYKLYLDELTDYEVEYNGKEQTVFQNYRYFKTALMSVAGTTKAKDIGTYQVTISLKDKKNYQWRIYDSKTKKVIFTTNDQKVEWKISKGNLYVPSAYTLNYNGEKQTIKLNYEYNADLMSVAGTTEAKEVGTYQVTISLKDKKNYQWMVYNEKTEKYTYTTNDQKIEWKIAEGYAKEVETYTIKATSGKHGSISPSGKVEVNEGDNQIFKFKPDENYEIDDVIVDGKSVGAVSKYTFSNVQKNHTIEVTFKEIEEKDTYTITLICGKHGKISPNKDVEVEKGEDVQFTFKPDEGYEVKDVVIDGDSIGAALQYKFENIKRNHELEVAFTQIKEENTNNNYQNPFKDIKEKDWYYSAVSFVNQKGLFKGVNDTEFGANVTMNRGMIVTVLHRLAKEEKANNITKFNDVKENDYYSNAVNWAVEKGITNGTGNGKFEPSSSVTREQLVVMIYRYAKMSGKDINKKANLLNYEDNNKIDDYAKEAFEWAIEEKIITGRTETELAPKGTATRAEVATILMRFIQNVK